MSAEDVALVGDDPGLEHGGGRLVAEHLDVEGAAPGDVEQALAQLRGAGAGVGAAQVLVALAHRAQLRAALGTVGGHDERVLVAGAGLDDRAEHLGDDVAGLADDHAVADEHALALDLAGVVQRGHRDRRARHEHRLHLGERA